MMSDASDMLAAALEQMDGIIAGSKALDYPNGLFDCQSPTSPFMGSLRALHLLEDLRSVLELMDMEERESLRCQIPDSTADSLVEWLQGHLSNGHIPLGGGDHYQERLSRLESDKESLVLQVSVLTDQVEAQGEKIRDLDLCLDEHRDKLNATEEMLQQELLCRTALETQKLELMSEASNLKLKLNAIEKERLDFDDRFRDSEDLILEINELRYRLTELESEKLQYEKKLKSTKEELAMLRRQLEGKDGETRRLQDEMGFKAMTSNSIDPTERVSHPDETLRKRLKEKHVEVQRMKKAVESLMAANEEKDRKIEELKQSLLRYKKVQDMVMSVQGRKEKSKDNENSESHSDASISSLLANPVCVDAETLRVTDAEQVKGKSPDELEGLGELNEEPSPTPSPSAQSSSDAERVSMRSLHPHPAPPLSHPLMQKECQSLPQQMRKAPKIPPSLAARTTWTGAVVKRIQVKKLLRSLRSRPCVPLPRRLPPQTMTALDRKKPVPLSEKVSSRSVGARGQPAPQTLLRQSRAPIIWIWPGCLRGQLTATAPTRSPQPQRAGKSPKELRNSLGS
ncbi:hypothetical protein LDENG_00269180 [Lucifuga dentata]|nr:hypothetical protein LDENG_00269180 [Lucifuga dentata]